MTEAKKQRSIYFLAFTIVAIVSFVAGTRYDAIFAAVAPVFGIRTSSETLDLSSVQETYRQLVANYDGDIDKEALIHGASRGLTEAVGDQHTAYMDPKEAEEFRKSISGSIGGGIGAEIGLRDGRATIVRTLNDSPAKKANIGSGETILKINSEEVEGWTIDQVVAKVRGEVGTSVKLTLLKQKEVREVSVTRQNITTPAVESSVDGRTGILKISHFNDDTVPAARKAASDFVDKGVTKVVVDLRDNPGGTVESARGLLGLWLKDRVALTERRGSEVIRTLKTTGVPILDRVQTVVLINGGSASASEIVAGALREHGNAKLVGQKSYGKGSMQSMIQLSGNSILKVTEARWYTPQGKNFDKSGIEPDEKVELTRDDIDNNRDPQLDKAKSL